MTGKKAMDLKEKIKQAIAALNEDAESRWQDERIIEFISLDENPNEPRYLLNIKIGKYNPTFHEVELSPDGWRVKSESEENKYLDDFIAYVVLPIMFEPNEKESYIVKNKSLFELRNSDKEDYYIIEHTDSGITVEFKEKHYNEEQKVHVPEDYNEDAQTIAHVLALIGDWAVRYHSSICFPYTYVFEYDDAERLCLCRTKYPKWRLQIIESETKQKLAASLRKAAEFLLKSPNA